MQTLGGLSLLAVLALCYALYFHSQPASSPAGNGDARVVLTEPIRNGSFDLRAAASPSGMYKSEINQARAAASQLQTAHDTAEAY